MSQAPSKLTALSENGPSRPAVEQLRRPPTSPSRRLDSSSVLQKKFMLLRHASFVLACLAGYVLLDRAAVYLQVWPNISAWYPPVGFALAVMIGMDTEAFLAVLLAGYLAGILNYHQSISSCHFC